MKNINFLSISKKIIVLTLFLGLNSLFAFEHLTSKNFEEKIKAKNAIIDFYATWCPPCKILAENLIEYDKVKNPNITIFKVDIDHYMDLAKKYNVRSLPTLVYFKDGKMIKKIVGIQDLTQLKNSSRKYFK